MSKQIYTFLLSLCAVLVWTSCSNDVADSGTTDDGSVDVTLTVAAREPYATGLATRAFSDTHATDGEMMKNYIIVAVNQSTGKITHILQSGDLGTEVESKLLQGESALRYRNLYFLYLCQPYARPAWTGLG